jgi:hypothetical protein
VTYAYKNGIAGEVVKLKHLQVPILFVLIFMVLGVGYLFGKDPSARNAIIAVIGVGLTAIVALWKQSAEDEQKAKDRASDHALQLTRMDYDIRIKALELSKDRRQFLAPVKVYRELYRAFLDLHTIGEWPDTIEKLGLLNIFEFGPDDTKQKQHPSG